MSLFVKPDQSFSPTGALYEIQRTVGALRSRAPRFLELVLLHALAAGELRLDVLPHGGLDGPNTEVSGLKGPCSA